MRSDNVQIAGTGGVDNASPEISNESTTPTPGAVHFVALNPRHRIISTPDADYTVRGQVGAGSLGDEINSYTLDHTRSSSSADTFSVVLNNPSDWGLVSFVINPAVPPVSHGLWISKAELDQRLTSGPYWEGTGELEHAADVQNWPDSIHLHDQNSKSEIYVLAGALAFARLYPDTSATKYRENVAAYLQKLVDEGFNKSTTALSWARNVGAFVIAADLINLQEYHPVLSAEFEEFIGDILTEEHTGGDGLNSLVHGAQTRPNNIGSWARWSSILVTAYLGDTATLNDLVGLVRLYLGDRTAHTDTYNWGGPSGNKNYTWQEDPNDPSTYRGIVRQSVIRDGNVFDGIQPEEMRRDGTEPLYDPQDFPNYYGEMSVGATRYVEEGLGPILGTIEVLRRLSHPAHTWSDYAAGRAATRLLFFADHHSTKGWTYFTEAHEAARPLVNFLYGYGLPEAKVRSQLGGANKGYGFTHWTHGDSTVVPGAVSLAYAQAVMGGEAGGSVGSVTTDGRINAGTDQLYLAQVSIHKDQAVANLNGGGLTWSLVGAKTGDRGVVRMEVWKAFGSPGLAFTVTANMVNNAESVALTVTRYMGASATLEDIQVAGTGGTDDVNPSVATTSTTSGAVHFVALNARNRVISSPDSDYTLLANHTVGIGGDEVRNLAHEYPKSSSGADTFAVTLNNPADWAIVAFVVNPS